MTHDGSIISLAPGKLLMSLPLIVPQGMVIYAKNRRDPIDRVRPSRNLLYEIPDIKMKIVR